MDGGPAPLVSIVVPVHNGERYLRESLDSIVAQTYRPLEVLVMDDASTDATPAIVRSFGDRVVHHRRSKRVGQFANVNEGVAAARGEFVAVYHADDVYEPEIVAREACLLQHHQEVAAVFAQDLFIGPDGRVFGRVALPPEVPVGRPLSRATVLEALLTHKNTFLRGPTSMVRASAYREVGPYQGKRWGIAADLDMWLRIAERHALAVLPWHLARYRRGHGSLSERYEDLRTEVEPFFAMMDERLAGDVRGLVSSAALRAYEGHRAEDRIKLAVNCYVLGRREEMREHLAAVRPRVLAGTHAVQRWRLLALLGILHALSRTRRIGPAASALHWRLGAR